VCDLGGEDRQGNVGTRIARRVSRRSTAPSRVTPVAAPSPHLSIPAMRDDLVRVEDRLLASVAVSDPLLNELAGHLIRAGGKRQRPAFAIAAAATALGPDGDRPATHEAVMGGVAVELVHLGSLYHDDVMDDAVTRRTVDSVNARWGNLKAILAGDFLLAKASEIAASLGTEVAGLLAATIARLCEGQIRELRDIYNLDRSVDDYTDSIAGKTAALFATACRVGAIVGDVPRPQVEALTRFGDRYGMAFQVVDDILDLVATTEELGKPSGNDLVEGVYTLPVLHALAPTGDRDPEALRSLLGKPLDPDAREAARELVLAGDGIATAYEVARSYADEAVAALDALGPSPANEGLVATTRALVDQLAPRVAA
jgi:heptaprenyl diphosphate synthase